MKEKTPVKTSLVAALTREQLSEIVANLYYTNQNKVLVQFATGAGKSKIALDLVNKDVLKDKHSTWHVLVPRLPLIENWKEEVKKWGYDSLLPKLSMLCYASAHKLDNPNNLSHNIILDEGHRITPNNLPYIKNYLGRNGKLIVLSATVSLEKKVLLADLGISKSNTIKYSLDNAVKDDLVSDYSIQVIQFPLDNVTKNVQGGKKGAYFLTTEQQGYQFKDQQVRSAMYSSRPDSTKWAILARMRFIYNLPTKHWLAVELLKILPTDKKIIIFCGSIVQANSLCKHRYHSKTDDKDFKDFCNGKINRIAVVNTVSEGINIPELDYALLLQVQSSDLNAIQKIGRLVRKTSDPNKIGKVIILEATGTQDSKWVQSALKSFDVAKINYISSTQFLLKGL